MEQKIPKILHCVWMGGGEKSELMKKCIDSWKKYCPDYEIMEWNEQNFDLDSYPIVRQAIERRNWSLASDVIRLWAIYNYGGIYFDTDVEVLRPLDDLLGYDVFFSYESKYWFSSATIGGTRGHRFFSESLKRYSVYMKENFSSNPLAVHNLSATAGRMYGIKFDGKTKMLDNNIALFATEYMAPLDYMSKRLKVTENTYLIHHYSTTWHSKSQKFWAGFAKRFRLIMGIHIYRIFEKIVAKYYRGVLNREYKKRMRSGVYTVDSTALSIAAAEDTDKEY